MGLGALTEGAKLRRKGILALALALAATLSVGVVVALAATSYSTKIEFRGNQGSSLGDQILFGDLKSNAKCVDAREMGLFKKTSSGYRLIDADLSSYSGAWAFRANLTGGPDLAIKVKKDKRNHGNVVCKPDTITLSASSQNYPRVR